MDEQIADIAFELERLNTLSGKAFVKQLELITNYKGFLPLEGETSIFHIGMEKDKDYAPLMDAAHKATEHGYTVYLLPNPRNCRTADFIFEKKGAYTMCARLLASDIRTYFEVNRNAVEVLLFKGKKIISVNRYSTLSPMFYRQFRKRYEQ